MTSSTRSSPYRICFSLAARFALAVLGTSAVEGQQTASATAMNLNLVFLDPAHGGDDPGAHLTEKLAEKDVTLALELKLRAALAGKGFAVISTRDGDGGLTSDLRAEMANHARPLACLLLHATSSGSGAYLAASSLLPDAETRTVLPWATAQASYVSASLALLDGMRGTLGAAGLKPVVLRASVPPVDSLACPAVVLELAPLAGTAVTDEGYQERVAEALTAALVAWKVQSAPPPKVPVVPAGKAGGDAAGAGTVAPRTPKVAKVPKPQPAVSPAGAAADGGAVR